MGTADKLRAAKAAAKGKKPIKKQEHLKEMFNKHQDKTGKKLVEEFIKTGKQKEIKLSDILLNDKTFQVRTQDMSKESFDNLVNSIKNVGLINPILVRPAPKKPGKYQLIAGFHRTKASTIANLKNISAIIKNVDDDTAELISEHDNIQRENLSPLDMWTLISKYEKKGFTNRQIEKHLNISEKHIQRFRRIAANKKLYKLCIVKNIMPIREAERIIRLSLKDQSIKLTEWEKAEDLKHVEGHKPKIKKTQIKTKPLIINNKNKTIKVSLSGSFKEKDKIIKELKKIIEGIRGIDT